MGKWITFDISDGTSNKVASCGLLLCSYGALLCVQCRLPHTGVGVWNWLSGFLTPPPIFRVLNSFFYIPWAHGTTRYMCQNGCFGGVFLVCQVMLTIEAKTSTPGQRIAARAAQSRKRKVDEESEDEDEDEEEEDEEDEEEEERESEMEIPEEEAKEEEKERKKKKPAKEKHTTKRRLPVPFFKEIKAEGSESASSPRTSKKGRKASTEDEERSAEDVRMGNALEAYGTTLPRLGQHVRQCLRGQPGTKTLLAAALQLMFECPNSILRGPLCIRSDYIVAQRKCMEPLRQAGGPQYVVGWAPLDTSAKHVGAIYTSNALRTIMNEP